MTKLKPKHMTQRNIKYGFTAIQKMAAISQIRKRGSISFVLFLIAVYLD